MAAQSGGSVRNIATNSSTKSAKSESLKTKLKRIAKIDRLPKDVRSSIPINGIMANGIIETYPGTFTKSYMLEDINFSIAPDEEQLLIFNNFVEMLNSFNEDVKWQFTIYNHEIDKKKTIEDIRIVGQKDGLNAYRREMNTILLENLKSGNNSIKRDKILTVAINDKDAKHAAINFNSIDDQIIRKVKKVTDRETKPMTTQERVSLLYNIYNQDNDYRMATGIYKDKEIFDLGFLEKQGLSVKDIIGPSSFDFTKSNMFMVGDTYAATLYLERIPSTLSTDYIKDLSDIPATQLITITSETINTSEATKLVQSKLVDIEAQVASAQKRNAENGFYGALPPELEKSAASARDLMNDITKRDQNLFYITVAVTVFARTQQQLEENIKYVKNVGEKHMCPLKTLKFQQEFAFNTTLPLCRNDIFNERLYTSESAGVFIPFNTQELMQKNAIFYGKNQVSKSMIMYDRTSGSNYNGLIFGFSGSGKSFTAKIEMISVLLAHKNAQVFVIDPQGEYNPLTGAMHGQEIYLAPGSRVYINPLDLDISTDGDQESDPVTMKSDFVLSMFEIMIGKGRSLAPIHRSIIDKCVRKIYRAYISDLERENKTIDVNKCPTLSDLYQELNLMKEEKYEAGQLADILYQYACGSFDTFAHRTNIETNARFVVYNTKQLGTGLKELGLHICINDIWNRMIKNSKNNIYTWFYIDEFHVLLESEGTTLFLKRIWKMARKWLGVPTGIMQNTEDILRNEDSRAIINNTNFVIMLREPLMDRQNLQQLFNLSPQQLEYITDSDPGSGLLHNGKVTIPFRNDFPKNTKLYSIMTTAHDVADSTFK